MIHSLGPALARTKRQLPLSHVVRAHAAAILRALILMLVSLLFVLIGLMFLTGNMATGLPVLAGVLCIGFGAAQFAR